MADDRWRAPHRPDPGPDTGTRPSARARQRLAADMGAELDLTRAAWNDALLRSDERLERLDARGALEALEDQRRLLRLLEDRLERVVASAAVERDAEGVVDGVLGQGPTPPARPDDGTGDAAPAAAGGESTAGGRVRALVAAGAAMAVTAVAIGLSALAGPVATPAPEVAGSPDGAPVPQTGSADVGAAVHDDGEVTAAGPDAPLLVLPAPVQPPALLGWSLVRSAPPAAEEPAPDADARGTLEDDGAAGESLPRDGGAADAADPEPVPPEPERDEGPEGDEGPRLDPDDADGDHERLLDLEPLVRPDEPDPDDPDEPDEDVADDDGQDLPEADARTGISPPRDLDPRS